MKLGIDFGSTYSTLSMYISSENRTEALTLMEGDSSNISSAVSVSKKKGTLMFGNSAKKKIGNDAFRVFEAFKMLLVETDERLISERGYTETYTPRYITKCFIEYLLTGVIKRYGMEENEIEELVLCVPAVWSTNIHTLDGRNILRDIISNDIELPDGWTINSSNIRIVSEPEAASAFFAYNYEQETGKSFNGHLLLIDYGGGTLDITLTKVSSDGDNSIEIGCREYGGAGENHPDSEGNYFVGNAGIEYMQKVTAIAIEESGAFEENEKTDFDSPEFRTAFHDLEDALKDPAHISSLEFFFGQYGDYSDLEECKEDEPEDFCYIFYKDEEIPVTYQQLFSAYQSTIEGVLENELRRMNSLVERHIGSDPCSIGSGLRDDFKIAIVGGFGSYYLVRRQIASIYHFDTDEQNDLRLKNVYSEKAEQAIALGAGLIASGRVILQKTAHFSIGIYSKNTENKFTLSYGIHFHQQVIPGLPYFLLHNNEKVDTVSNRTIYAGLKNNIKQFVVQFSEALDRGLPMAIKSEFLHKLDELPDAGMWYCGFSMDINDVISFHIEPVEALKDQYKGLVIPLDNYTNLFDLTAGKEVYADEA